MPIGRVKRVPACPFIGFWANQGHLPLARSDLGAAVPIPSPLGGSPSFYVVGGVDNLNVRPELDVIQPTLGWPPLLSVMAAPLPAMPTPRRGLAAVCIGQKLYALGGMSSPHYKWGQVFLDVVEEYDPAGPPGNWWTTKTPMPTARMWLAAAAVGNRVYAVGGQTASSYYVDTLEMYDQATNKWTTLPPMPTARAGPAAAAIGDMVYVVGGLGPGAGLTGRKLEAYDTVNHRWTSLPSMPTGRLCLAAAVLNGRLYAIGGLGEPLQAGESRIPRPLSTGAYYPLSDVEVYDPATRRWCVAPHMLTPRAHLAAVALTHTYRAPGSSGHTTEGGRHIERIYAIGGQTPGINLFPASASIEVYPT